MSDEVKKSNEEWKELLTEEQYHVTREKGTEAPFTGKYNVFKEDGIFKCICCGNELFDSAVKYDSGSGWPSFWEKANEESVAYKDDFSIADRPRTEVLCKKCGAHLGHIFDDGPNPTGKRYCINSVAVNFEERE